MILDNLTREEAIEKYITNEHPMISMDCPSKYGVKEDTACGGFYCTECWQNAINAYYDKEKEK